MNLADKKAIVTGAAQGIGKTIALQLALHGADVVVTDINREGLASVVAEIQALGRRAHAIAMDVSNLAQCEDMVKEAVQAMGRIDILVNNAGITRDTLLLRMKEEQWDQVMQVNVKGTFNCTKLYFAPCLSRNTAVLSRFRP